MTTKRREILEQAADLVDGDRDAEYGTPQENLGRIAEFWTTYFGFPVRADQVALAMALVKIARLVHQPDHPDSPVDGAGYFGLAGELAEEPSTGFGFVFRDVPVIRVEDATPDPREPRFNCCESKNLRKGDECLYCKHVVGMG